MMTDEHVLTESLDRVRRGSLGRRQSLSLPEPRQAERRGARLLSGICSAIARAVVGDDHLGVRKSPPQRRDGAADRRLLVAGRNESRCDLSHVRLSRVAAARRPWRSP